MVKLLVLPAATVKPRMSLRPLSAPLGTTNVKREPFSRSMYEVGWFSCVSTTRRNH
jgi:hypothetical protein